LSKTLPREPWWKEAVVYEVYLRSFQDSNGDGIGDLLGITHRLDYMQSRGVDAIWLSPFYPSPMRDGGYDVKNYIGVDPLFGKMADFDRILREIHKRGMRMIIDYVPNHTSDQHPWFKESRSSLDSPKRDWYVWRDPAPDGEPPNNWLSMFGGSAWHLDLTTRQYYLATFLRQQPDLNWRCLALKAAMLDVIRSWLDRGVDGIRVDVVYALAKDPAFRDDPQTPASSLEIIRTKNPCTSIAWNIQTCIVF
jgi:alpha-glucosidase